MPDEIPRNTSVDSYPNSTQPPRTTYRQPMQPAPTPRYTQTRPAGSRNGGRWLAFCIFILLVGIALIAMAVHLNSSGNASAQNPYGGTLVLDDPLSDNSKGYKWDETTDSAGGACQFKDGAYHASIPQIDDEICPAEAPSFDNFAFQVNMVIANGDGGGVMFRLDKTILNNGSLTKLNCYEFLIRPNGSYILYMYHYAGSGNTPADILSQGTSSAINTGLNQSNLIAVVARDSNITFYVNNQQVGNINDSRYSSGQIAVLADDIGNSAEAIFTNAKVWKL